MTLCYTCPNIKHWKEMDAGHFASRRHQSTKFDERNVHSTCTHCNRFLNGNQYIYGKMLDLQYGEGTADALIQQSRQVVKRSKAEIKDMTNTYREEAQRIAREKGIQL
jgi:hypothetical protein